MESLSSKKKNVKCVSQMFPLNMHGLNLITNEINYGLIKEDNFIIHLFKTGWTIMIFQCTPHIMKASQ